MVFFIFFSNFLDISDKFIPAPYGIIFEQIISSGVKLNYKGMLNKKTEMLVVQGHSRKLEESINTEEKDDQDQRKEFKYFHSFL